MLVGVPVLLLAGGGQHHLDLVEVPVVAVIELHNRYSAENGRKRDLGGRYQLQARSIAVAGVNDPDRPMAALAAADPFAVAEQEPLSEDEARYVAAARAANTLRGYRSDWALEMAGGDVARGSGSLSLVLDQVPGVVRHAEVTELTGGRR